MGLGEEKRVGSYETLPTARPEGVALPDPEQLSPRMA